jgi:hypothetical protein
MADERMWFSNLALNQIYKKKIRGQTEWHTACRYQINNDGNAANAGREGGNRLSIQIANVFST